MQQLIQDLDNDAHWSGIILLNSWHTNLEDAFIFEEAMRLLNLEQQASILRKKTHSDKYKTLCNRILQLAGISIVAKLPHDQLQFELHPYGKPRIKTFDPIYFSMSNGEHYVGQYILKGGFHEVGIDLASVSDYHGHQDLVHFGEIFSPQEFETLIHCGLSKRPLMFAYYWSLKECYTKYTGLGLNSELCQIDFGELNLFEGETTIKKRMNHAEMWFYSKWITNNEIVTVCHELSAGRDQNPRLYHFTLQEVLDQLRNTCSKS